MAQLEQDRQIRAVAALADPVRRSVYDYVAAQTDEVSRDQAAAAIGISRSLAVFHLDRLVREGLLDASYRRLGERTGPGAGRPSKLYRRTPEEVAVNLPRREYELAARLLLQATVGGSAEGSLDALNGAARDAGHALGREQGGGGGDAGAAPADRLLQVLRDQGYEPFLDSHDVVRLRNCPFHALARREPEAVCGMNLSLIRGVLDGLGDVEAEAELDFRPDLCCVAVRLRHRHHLRRRGGRKSTRARSQPGEGSTAAA